MLDRRICCLCGKNRKISIELPRRESNKTSRSLPFCSFCRKIAADVCSDNEVEDPEDKPPELKLPTCAKFSNTITGGKNSVSIIANKPFLLSYKSSIIDGVYEEKTKVAHLIFLDESA